MSENRKMEGPNGACQGREEAIAAMVDGGLPADELDVLRQHIAGCEVCFELLTELMHLVGEVDESDEADEPVEFGASKTALDPDRDEDLGPGSGPTKALPFVGSKKPKRTRLRSVGGLLAAAILVALAIPFLRSQDPTSAHRLAADLSLPKEGLGALARSRWEEPSRRTGNDGRPLAPTTQSFRAGVRFMYLHLALVGERRKVGQMLCSELLDLARRKKSEPMILALEDLYDGLDLEPSPSTLISKLKTLESDLASSGVVDPLYFSLGKLTEASRLAAGHGLGEFFADSARRQAWVSILEELGPAAEPSLVEALELWKKRPLLDSDMDRLAKLYRQAFDFYGEVPDRVGRKSRSR